MLCSAATFLVATLCAASPAAAAAVNARSSSIDYSPPITSPKLGDVWISGLVQTVTWNTTLPAGITSDQVSQTGIISLGYITDDSENLDWVLASHVPLYATGSYNVTLPAGLDRMDNYIIALQGSSGNISPQFTILTAPVPPPEPSKEKRERKLLALAEY